MFRFTPLNVTAMFHRFYFALAFMCVGLMTTPVLGRSYAALVMNGKGQVLHHVNGHTSVYPASLTKMMTLYLVFTALHQKKLRLGDHIKVSAHAASQPPCKLGLKAGQMITVKQAILGMITKSANDAAAALAEKLGGTELTFARQMTLKARGLGLKNTVFYNASGLPHPQQKTTSYDMALLGRALVQHFPAEYRYFNTKNFAFRGCVYKNHNHLLGQVPGVDGIKTGYIEKSGFNLVASVKRGPQRLFVVVMGGKTGCWRNQHVTDLIQAAYSKPHSLPLITAKACPAPLLVSTSPERAGNGCGLDSSLDTLLTLSDQDTRS